MKNNIDTIIEDGQYDCDDIFLITLNQPHFNVFCVI